MRTRLLPVAVALALLTGCAGTTSDGPDPKSAKPDTSKISIEGDASAPVNQLAIAAIADLQAYWSDEFPRLYGDTYAPVKGGLYALTSQSDVGPKCASSYADVQGNAFYCKLDDSVAWDAEELLPDLQEKYDDFVIPVVLAHEWGHAMQQRSGFFDENSKTVSSELQADCFAGGWARHAQDSGAFKVTSADLDTALAGILDLRDTPGTSSDDQSAHGSGFDRVSAFQDLPRVNFLMLNPSTADALTLDPTVTRCATFARSWGYGQLAVTNCFALRSTDPAGLRQVDDPVGEDNDAAIVSAALAADTVVAAWGVHAAHLDRATHVRRLLADSGVAPHVLRMTKHGHPGHPLYVPGTTTTQPWQVVPPTPSPERP